MSSPRSSAPFRLAAVTLVALTAVLARADGLIIIDNPAAPGVRHPFAPLRVEYHKVEVKITGQVAQTTVEQSFFNPNPQRLEGTYVFPIPKGANIDTFSMEINGRQVEAELLDASRARGIYEDIVRRLRDPALLEYSGQGLYKVRIFPLEPNASKRIRMRYTELLRKDAGLVAYRYPLNTEKFSSAAVDSVAVRVELECAEGIRTVYSPSHPVEVRRPAAGKAVVGWEASHVTPDSDFELYYAPEAKVDVGVDVLAYRDGADDGYFLLLASPSAQLPSQRVVAKDVVFVLDTSGSMADRGKIDQAKRALQLCVRNLNPGDRFEIVRFSTEAEALMGGLVEATDANRKRAEEQVARLKPIGGTAIEDALRLAIEAAGATAGRDRPYAVVFLTDGRPTVGATDEETLTAGVRRAIGDRSIRVFCFGIGTDVNTKLLDRITEDTRAVSQYVLPEEDIEVKVSSFFTKINYPVLANPKLKLSGPVRLTRLHPGELPDLYRGDQLVVLGRYSGSGDGALTLEGTVNGQPWRFTYDARFPSASSEHPFIPRLWATRRVGYLLDQIRLHGENAELRDEVVALARSYGIVTPYTAYLIVEDEAKRGVPVTAQSLPTVERDQALRDEARGVVGGFKSEASGDAAVGGAKAMDALKSAVTAEAPAMSSEYARRGSAAAARVDQALSQVERRYLGGRTFYRNGERWVDASIQTRPTARRTQVKFNTDEYFALLARHPEAAPWLALGRQVEVLLGDTVVEVVE